MQNVIRLRKLVFAFFGLLAAILIPYTGFAAKPVITTQPQSKTVIAGSNAVFSVIANGSPSPTYQWSLNTINLTNGVHIAGAKSATLTVSNVTIADTGNYRVTVSNSFGSVTSSNAVLTVVFPPAIIGQPVDQTVTWGNPAVFTGSASGTAPLYSQWQKDGTNLTDGGAITGSATATLNISAVQPANAGQYKLVVTNAYGSAQSSNVNLFVTPVLAWGNGDGDTNAPAAATNLLAFDTSWQFTVALRQDGQVIAWGPDVFGETVVPATATNVVAVRACSYSSVALREDGSFVIWGHTAFGEANVPPNATNVVAFTSGGDTTVGLREDGTLVAWGDNTYGEASTPVSASNVVAVASGTFYTLALRADRTVVAWGDNLFGQTNVPPTATNVIAIACGREHGLALRADGTVVGWGLNDAGEVTVPPSATNVIAIAAGGYHSEAMRADGSIIGWGQDDNGQNDTPPLPGQPVLLEAGAYHSAVLLRDPRMRMPPRIWKQPGSRSSIIPGQTIIFRASVLGALPIRYQWLRDGAAVPGATNVWLALSSVHFGQGGNYQFYATNDFGAVTSSVANLTVLQPPQVTQDIQPQTVIAGTNVTFSVAVIGDAPLHYQWSFNGTPLNDGGNFTGSQTPTLQIASAQPTNTGVYSVVITNAAGTASSSAELDVVPPPVFTEEPTSTTNVVGVSIILSVTASDADSYQWFFNGAPMTDSARITGTSDSLLSIHSLQTNDTGGYWAIATNIAGAVTSSVATIMVLDLPPAFGTPPASQIKALGDSVTFSSLALGSQPIGYQWFFEGTPLSDGARVTGATNYVLNITALQTNDAGHYWLVASNDAGVTTGAVATLTVVVPPSFVLLPTNQTWFAGSTGSFSVVVTGTEPLSYQWYHGATQLADDARFSGTGSNTLSVSNVQTSDAGSYTVVVTNFAGTMSAAASVSVIVPPSITTQPRGRSAPVGLPAIFNASVSGSSPLAYQWQLNGTNLPGATFINYTNSFLTTNDFGAYQIVVTNAGGSVTSSVAMLTLGPVAAWFDTRAGPTLLPPVGLSNVVAIAANSGFSLALKSDGTVVAWGSGAVTNVPANVTNIVSIAAGGTFGLGVRGDGTVTAWGTGTATNVPGTISNVVLTSGGSGHVLGLRTEGTLVEWGNSLAKSSIPAGLTRVTSIADGTGFSLVSRADGLVVAWGSFSPAGFINPNPPSPLTNAVSVVAGSAFGLALKSDGRISAWGGPATLVTNVPASLTNVTAIACNGGVDQSIPFTLALRSNGLVSAWGGNTSATNVPPGLSNVVAISAGSTFGLALVSDGSPIIIRQPVGGTAFSGNQFTLSATVASPTPVTYAWSFNGTNILNATNSSFVISNAQPGDAGLYQLSVTNAVGNAASIPVPITVVDSTLSLLTFPPGTNRPFIGSSFTLGAALVGSGPMQIQWRLNGQDLPGGTNVDLIFSRTHRTNAGNYTLMVSNSFGAVTSSITMLAPMSVVGWGSSVYGTTNPPINLSDAVAIAVNNEVAEALRANGTVATWGMLSAVPVPPDITNVVEVANSTTAAFALKADGTVRGWNIFGAFSNSLAGLSNIVSLEADGSGSTFLNADGTVTRILGAGTTNFYPQLTNVVELTRSANNGFAALLADGTVTNFYNGTILPPPATAFSNVYDIAIDTSTGTSLKRDRTLQAWGVSVGGPTTSTNFSNMIGVSIDAGIRSNGTVAAWTWTANAPGLTNSPSGLANVVAVEGNQNATLALMAVRDFQSLLLPDALDTAALVVSSRGSPRWYAETNVTHDGLHAAQSAEIESNTASSMRMWVAGPVSVSFWWKVSSETNHDFLSFSAGGVVLTNISGETGWRQCTVVTPPGNQILQWAYSKDAGGTAGQDAGWVDQLVITPVAASILAQPVGTNISGGMNVGFTFTVSAIGTPPLTYQWSKDGNVLAAGTSSNYSLFNLTRGNSGIYRVMVTNVAGNITSSNAVLTVHVPQLLSAPILHSDGTITFNSSDADGGPLSSSDLAHLQVQASSNLVDWVTLPNALTLQDGRLQLQDSNATNAPTRYYRLLETW
jgi:alpha-tubulin suppressor-like RCC1 family protein